MDINTEKNNDADTDTLEELIRYTKLSLPFINRMMPITSDVLRTWYFLCSIKNDKEQ